MVKKLSEAQKRMLLRARKTGQTERLDWGGRNAGRNACAWDRTAASLVKLGLGELCGRHLKLTALGASWALTLSEEP
jgi:hypothetical protein